MSSVSDSSLTPAWPPPVGEMPPVVSRVSELSGLLEELQTAASAGVTAPPVISPQADNQLVQVRLGIAAGLFSALQQKNAATAGHSLRVALSCSAWAAWMGVAAEERDLIEVAALLHDVGLIGVPDPILLKPAALDADETSLMSRGPEMSVQILRHCCASDGLLLIVRHIHAWFNGPSAAEELSGAAIPRGSRMIAIVEAFDAMTTDRVYRPAMSEEAALVELFECAGTQFDPALVRRFAEFHRGSHADLLRAVSNRWLKDLDPALVNSFWQHNAVSSTPAQTPQETIFQSKLVDNMYDAVAFIDAGLRVLAWNHGAERLTGIPATAMRQKSWQNSVLEMCDEKGRPVNDADCPVHCALRSGVQSLRRFTIAGRGRRAIAVDTHVMPVAAVGGQILGAVVLMHDASPETSLEQRCQKLYEKATKDLMTDVANRAEFDRVHETFIAAHQQQQAPCSMLICDLDRFKLVNDTYGHQAGDDAIKALATLLKSFCRPGDLVARYGGEEFVMLLADCDNATAARRAESIRRALGQLPQPRLDGRSVTASFGVTEVQPGDTPETMLRRADRALLTAKGKGRNMVVQLGVGGRAEVAGKESQPSLLSRKTASGEMLIQQDLVTPVPIKIAIEKLRGFVADHQAKILVVDGNSVRLEIANGSEGWLRRRADRAVEFVLDIGFEEEQLQKEDGSELKDGAVRTLIRVGIFPRKSRDRRRSDLSNQAREVLASFRSYLMTTPAHEAPEGVFRRVRRLLGPWR